MSRIGILIEGANGSGKSTLANALSTCTGLPVKHAGPHATTLLSTFKCIREQLSWLRKGYILDRCTPVSEQVYNENVNKLLKVALNVVYYCLYRRHIIIFCTGVGAFTNKKYYTRDHYREITAKQEKIRCNYETFFKNKKHVKYNFGGQHGSL